MPFFLQKAIGLLEEKEEKDLLLIQEISSVLMVEGRKEGRICTCSSFLRKINGPDAFFWGKKSTFVTLGGATLKHYIDFITRLILDEINVGKLLWVKFQD